MARSSATRPVSRSSSLIPYAERSVRPVRFWLTGEWPADLFATVEDVIADYDGVMKASAIELRGGVPVDADMVVLDYNGFVRKVDATGLEADCRALEGRGAATVEVLEDGRPACGFRDYGPSRDAAFFDRAAPRDSEWAFEPERRAAVLGDLVHHVIHWVHAPQQAGPLGYGPSHIDPETGQTIAAQAAVYGHALDTYATLTLAAINVQNGRLSADAYLAGEVDAVDQLTSGEATLDLTDPTAALRRRLLQRGIADLPADVALLGEAGARDLEHGIASSVAFTSSRGRELLAAAVAEDTTAASLLAVESAEPESSGTYADFAMIDAVSARQRRALENNVTLAEFYDPFTLGTASRFKDFPSPELVPGASAWREIRRVIAAGLIAHEVGHTFGLRHNFRSSHDAINYTDRYWDLRQSTLKPASELDGLADIIASAQPSQEQLEAGMPAEAYASVMDYSATFDNAPRLGRFDRAALMLLYSGRVEVFDSPAETIDPELRDAARAAFLATDRFTQAPVRRFHYAQVPYLLGAGDAAAGVAALRKRRWVRWDEVLADLELGSAATLVPVPYEACTDYELGGPEGCLTFDAGADPYEMAVAIASRYEHDVISNHRRDRARFRGTPETRFARSLTRFFLPFRNIYQHGMSWSSTYPLDYSTPRDGLWFAGAYVAVNTLGRVLSTPAYGPVVSQDGFVTCPPDSSAGPDALVVPRGAGRRLDTLYQATTDFPEISEIGHRADRRAAMYSLVADWHYEPLVADLGTPWSLGFEGSVMVLASSTFLADPKLSPRINADGTVTFSDPLDPLTANGLSGAPPPGCVLDVARDDLERYVAVPYVAAYLRESLNYRIADRFRVFRVGTAEEPPVSPGHEIVSFIDPETGIAYGALRALEPSALGQYVGAIVVERGAAITVALEAGDLSDDGRALLEAELQEVARDAALLRSIIHQFDALATGVQ